MQWLRSVVGVAAGLGQVYAGGADVKHLLAAALLAGMGIVSHLTSPQQ